MSGCDYSLFKVSVHRRLLMHNVLFSQLPPVGAAGPTLVV